VASKGVTTGTPSAPVITIAVVIEPNRQPLVLEVMPKTAGDYRCRVLATPKGMKARTSCQASS
jgi:hypothetical protein